SDRGNCRPDPVPHLSGPGKAHPSWPLDAGTLEFPPSRRAVFCPTAHARRCERSRGSKPPVPLPKLLCPRRDSLRLDLWFRLRGLPSACNLASRKTSPDLGGSSRTPIPPPRAPDQGKRAVCLMLLQLRSSLA